MQVKTFEIRLDREHLHADQEALNKFASTVDVRKSAVELTGTDYKYWSVLLFYHDGRPVPKASEKIFFAADTVLTAEEGKIYDALKDWRQVKAQTLNLPVFWVVSNTELVSIVKAKPQQVSDLINIRGFGAQKIAKYGEDIIALLNSVG